MIHFGFWFGQFDELTLCCVCRALITMTVSAIWHGVYVGYYLCLMSAPLYMPVEDVYVKISKDTTGLVCIFLSYM